jgi:Na+/melibiose symporter-like transporter
VTRRAAAFLYVFAGWTVFVWVVFIKNIAKGHQFSTGFKAVHITLAVISIAFAAGCFTVVRRSRRPQRVGADR